MYSSRTSSKGQVVIPKEMRDRLGIKAGGRVGFSLAADHVAVYPLPDDPVEEYHGVFRKGSSLTKALIRERRREVKLEEDKGARRLRPAGVPEGRKRQRSGRKSP